MFEIVLFSLVMFTGAIILICKVAFPDLAKRDPEPWYLDYARSFFPVLLIVFLLRGFVAEPFRIPSGSMLPTLEVGDFILVNKFRYGIRLPILHKKVIEVGNPQRGDIVVFRYPLDNTTNYIKRVVGLPGDRVEYRKRRVYVNDQLVEVADDGEYTPFPIRGPQHAHQRFKQTIALAGDEKQTTEFSILHDPQVYGAREKAVVVPQGQYFVMGDNRDHSQDSRYWGFVPDENIVGNAFFIWFHYNGNPGGGFKLSRVGSDI